ncbi:flagellar protein FlaG [Lederbergia wuyishanensis]|uniref:Flagellar protein FlaG n=1 Tax=Lederbergia wuyishanensis TaxID=1347903 RepID=A0ABU0D8T2_9BACI|nr:flagellar protein FlaG [Lederbergia wuyishanensis]MCJ8007625.1 flagellar protein FlaG [Lederbergia wuyishanensis]MDQ0344790.1 flagellar protein FlaG [Lederbergia wuyishanensis]
MVGQVGGGLSVNLSIKEPVSNRAEGVNVSQEQSQDVEKVKTSPNLNSIDQLEKVVSSMNDFLKASPNTHLKFQYHDKLNEYYVTIVDEATQEVVKEIPAKRMLDIFAAMTEYLGLMVDKKI